MCSLLKACSFEEFGLDLASEDYISFFRNCSRVSSLQLEVPDCLKHKDEEVSVLDRKKRIKTNYCNVLAKKNKLKEKHAVSQSTAIISRMNRDLD